MASPYGYNILNAEDDCYIGVVEMLQYNMLKVLFCMRLGYLSARWWLLTFLSVPVRGVKSNLLKKK